jgi:diguanylate cyclase (GGDEF)-like protein
MEMFFIGLFCLSVIALVVVTMLSMGIYRAGLAAAEERVAGANRQISAYIEAHLEGLAASVRILAASPDVIRADTGGEESRERAKTYFRFVEISNPSVKYCYAGYASGELLINNYEPPDGYNPQIRPWYVAAVNSWPQVKIGLPYRDATTQEWLVAVSSAFFDKTELRGVVSVDSTLTAMDGLLNSLKPFGSQSNFVVSAGGLLLVHNERRDRLGQNMDTLVPGSMALLKGSSGHIEYHLPGSGTRMAFFTKLRINDWIIVSAVNRDEVMAPIRKRIVLTVLVTALTTLLLGMLQLKVYESRFVEPIMTLKQRIADITAGRSAGMKPATFSNGEMAAIADSIEGMTESSLGRKAVELRIILETTSDGLLVLDDQDLVMHYNQRFLELWGFTDEIASGSLSAPLVEHIGDAVLPEFADKVLREGHAGLDAMLRLKSGAILEQSSRPLLEHGRIIGRLWSFKDVTIKILAEEKLKLLATTDDLTGLWNRRCFMNRAGAEIAQAFRFRRPLCLALMDADHFKHINDTYGHAAGDAALKYLADELRSRLRASDTIGRIGGEELAIILPGISLEAAHTLLDQIRIAIGSGHFTHAGKDISFTVSTGIAAMPDTRVSVDELLSVADAACYKAKTNGRNRTEAQSCEVL